MIEKNNLTRLGDTSAKWKVSTSLVTLSVRYLKNIRSATWPRSLSPMSKLSTSGPGCWLHISLMCAIVWSWQWWLRSGSELSFFFKINPKFRVWWLSVLLFSDFSDECVVMLFRHHLPWLLVFLGMGCFAGKALEARWLEIGVGLWWTRLLLSMPVKG